MNLCRLRHKGTRAEPDSVAGDVLRLSRAQWPFPLKMALLCLGGWAARLQYVGAGRAFWDEIYQFVEPAVWQLTGVGVRTWEYQEGMRNWLLPTYYGGFLRLASVFRLSSLQIYTAMQVINTLWSLWLIPAVYRLGVAASAGRKSVGWLAAALVAFLAPIVFYSATLLSELPAMVLMTWAWVYWYELMQGRTLRSSQASARMVGLLLGTATVLRYSFVLGALPIVLELIWRRQGRLAGWVAVGACLPLTVLAFFDTIAWGTPWHSAWAYFNHNILQGKAAKLFAKQPASYYWDTMFRYHFRLGRLLLLPWAVVFLHRHMRAFLGCVLPLLVLSCIDHKEERFASFTWPLLLVACSHGLVLALDALKYRGGSLGRWLHARRHAVMMLVGVVVLASSAKHLRFERYDADAYRVAAWAGMQPDCGGFMSDADDGGGYFIFARSAPLLRWDAAALYRSDVTYLAVHDTAHRTMVGELGTYRFVRYEGRFAVYRRVSRDA